MNAPFSPATTRIGVCDFADAALTARIDAFVAEHDGSLFHLTDWSKAVEQGTRQEATGLFAERSGAIAGWLPLTLVHSPLFGRALVSSGFGVGGGPLAVSKGVAELLCREAERLALRQSCTDIELRGGDAPAYWHCWDDKHCGFETDLAVDDEAQLTAIPRKQRAEIRKGLKNDLTVETGRSEADRAAHYAVYAESVHNLGTPVFPRGLFDAMLDRFADADILTVRHEGRPVASVLSFYHGGAVMPYWGGGTTAARGLRANERMYYELMCHARRKGMARFDFGRSKNGSGPWHYKKNWGFEPQPLRYAGWTAPGHARRDVDPTSAAYSAKIELWKKLPLGLANRIGPFIARGLA
ncbi:FemAB family XrtA/PEP-CTERM system-associated protein [Qipengyuania sp. JC766]|uniref:FemAB family XrtA/PEP-CTERM system-associated protein n=1 Tax=Qipengyuania sp. JC766 TaxID=3232139 RepID=UPI0034576EC7